MTASVTRNVVILLIICALAAGGAALCSTVAAPHEKPLPPIGAVPTTEPFGGDGFPATGLARPRWPSDPALLAIGERFARGMPPN